MFPWSSKPKKGTKRVVPIVPILFPWRSKSKKRERKGSSPSFPKVCIITENGTLINNLYDVLKLTGIQGIMNMIKETWTGETR